LGRRGGWLGVLNSRAKSGAFKKEIVPVRITEKNGGGRSVEKDEEIERLDADNMKALSVRAARAS